MATIDLSLPIYQKLMSFLDKKLDNHSYFNNGEKQKEIEYVFSLGLEKAERELECKILFEEKKPRQDVMKNLGKIAIIFLAYPDYPNIKAPTVSSTINKIMPLADYRTKNKYQNCVEEYIGDAKEFGECDVSNFVDRIPNEFLKTTSSTSSSEDIK